MTEIDFPFHVDSAGRTAQAASDKHIRDLIEQVLFTAPGERVNRPSFGSGLMQMVFEPAHPELASATQMLVQGMLQQWLGDLIDIGDVDVDVDESVVTVTVRYVVKLTKAAEVAVITQVTS
jgi:phage baseplate assembly protein W